jgi:hypothetical protein
MESVLTTTRIKLSRTFFRIEACIFLIGGVFGLLNVNLLVKGLVGGKNYQVIEGNPISRGELKALHPVLMLFLILVAVLGVVLFYVAQAAIDPALKRISFIFIFLYFAILLILWSSPKPLAFNSAKTPLTKFLILLFALLFAGHASEIVGILKRRIIRKFKASRR